jgi:phosphatidylserine decarboxylase
MSHVWGKFAQIRFPAVVNTQILQTYSQVYGCNLNEMKEPLESYKSIQEFFVRRLKEDARPFVKEGIASPVDGKIMSIQEVARDQDQLEQIKGIEYSLSGFLGESIARMTDPEDQNRLYHCIIYLAPGDYHGIHSPVDWKVTHRRFFAGYLFPVAPVVVRRLQNLLGMNERAVLSGQWEHGYFSLSPVGATNVGSITLSTEPVRRRRSDMAH